MSIDKCRVCGNRFFPEPLLRYANMPGAAQYFPDASMLAQEKGVDLEVCQCSGCGLTQLNNEPVPYYKEVIRAAAFSPEMGAFRERQFKAFIKEFSLSGKKVVEIGCGGGEYLTIMEKCGAAAYGLEYSGAAVADCRAKGLKVAKGFIDHAGYILADAPFDAFFILNYLEHLPDINDVLLGIYSNLTGEGLGLVEVPNFDMIIRSNLFSEFIGDHLFYFTKETLISTLTRSGFEIVKCDVIWHDYIISAVIRKRPRLNLDDFYNCQIKLQSELERFISGFRPGKVAIWGAGHQALALIALAELSDKIKYVVDSATFKQGKYTPASHLPVVSPETLEKDPVDAIIVMAASYSDEVAQIIQLKYGGRIKIAILRDFGLELV